MTIEKIVSGGVAHQVPADLEKALLAKPSALAAWEGISALARNEWICWVESVKKQETRAHHISRAVNELTQGKKRPCCWLGCIHRTDKPINATQKWIIEKQKKAA